MIVQNFKEFLAGLEHSVKNVENYSNCYPVL